jgi:superfamily II DNA helicase RecQ
MEQIQCFTVPELKQLAERYQLDTTGTKSHLRTRISVRIRDEIANGCTDMGIIDHPVSDNVSNDIDKEDTVPMSMDQKSLHRSTQDVVDDESDDENEDDSSVSSSEDELELIGAQCHKFTFQTSDSAQTSTVPLHEEVEADLADNTKSPMLAPVYSTLKKLFGYNNFRDGQLWAIQRCMNRQRSLLVAPTGFGKSLCYTLPAAMMDGVCIVVSPLLSLIQDQIRMLPARLAAVTLSGPMSTAHVAATLDDIVRGRIKILFVSPERLTSNSFRRLFRPTWNPTTNKKERYFPDVSLLCVDEAHCMSQWAHNFRPSYLRLRSIIDLIDPRSILAITATAGPRVVDDICRTLKIESVRDNPEKGVRVSKTNRDNIDVKCLFLHSQEERLSKVCLFVNA